MKMNISKFIICLILIASLNNLATKVNAQDDFETEDSYEDYQDDSTEETEVVESEEEYAINAKNIKSKIAELTFVEIGIRTKSYD